MKHGVVYGALIVANAGLVALSQQLGAGNVPIPVEWQWTVPILGAMLVATTALLPRIGDTAP